jgi:hypothetical protein
MTSLHNYFNHINLIIQEVYCKKLQSLLCLFYYLKIKNMKHEFDFKELTAKAHLDYVGANFPEW